MSRIAADIPIDGTAERIPGSKAIWVGIFAELTEFALMFLVYFVSRAHHPNAFSAGVQKLSTLAGTANTLIIATTMAVKGRMVIDHFMELTNANRTIRRMVRLYGVVIPVLLMLTYVFGPQIARVTSL